MSASSDSRDEKDDAVERDPGDHDEIPEYAVETGVEVVAFFHLPQEEIREEDRRLQKRSQQIARVETEDRPSHRAIGMAVPPAMERQELPDAQGQECRSEDQVRE